eukprot:1097778_1
MRACATMLAIFLIITYQCSSTWIQGSTQLPKPTYGVALGYDATADTILIFGGDGYFTSTNTQFIKFKDHQFTMVDPYYLTTAQKTYGRGQHYTQLGDDLWTIRDDGGGFIKIDTETYVVTDPLVNIEDPVDIGGCLLSVPGFIIVAGGGEYSWMDKVQIYDIDAGEWLSGVPSLANLRRDAACVTVNNKAYVIGGHGGSTYLDSIEELDVANLPNTAGLSWNMLPGRLASGRYGARAAAHNTYIFVVGGYTYTWTTDVDIIDTISGSCALHDTLAFAAECASAIIVNDVMYAFGGYNGADGDIWDYQYTTLPVTTLNPSSNPSIPPTTRDPTQSPSENPTKLPTGEPSKLPTEQPSKEPTIATNEPSYSPSEVPSKDPIRLPSANPNEQSSTKSTDEPSNVATYQTTEQIPTEQTDMWPFGDKTLAIALSILSLLVIAFIGNIVRKQLQKHKTNKTNLKNKVKTSAQMEKVNNEFKKKCQIVRKANVSNNAITAGAINAKLVLKGSTIVTKGDDKLLTSGRVSPTAGAINAKLVLKGSAIVTKDDDKPLPSGRSSPTAGAINAKLVLKGSAIATKDDDKPLPSGRFSPTAGAINPKLVLKGSAIVTKDDDKPLTSGRFSPSGGILVDEDDSDDVILKDITIH